MFKKVLIANRGTIAFRVIRTARKLGIASVAVYSDSDRHSLHVAQADEAVHIGPSPAAQSYLSIDAIIKAAVATGAEAVHPGYGFLSEKPEFSEACDRAGIAFIGPTPEQMRVFGLKHTARSMAASLDVPLLPGTELLTSADDAREAARRIGYPVMLKSTAGGGGIGIRLCRSEVDLDVAFDTVQRLGANNFGDSGAFIERFIEQARHIEVQIFGDGAGNVVALGERDCSVQRRNQKVIEETPAPGITSHARALLFDYAMRIGKAVNYRSAGTVEYVYDNATGEFFFLEVNTRLQVEHGVTEEVTGIDLVEWMILQASGDLPPLPNHVPVVNGHSIEVRLYAEDAGRDFQPSSGRLTHVEFPKNVRVETWVEPGSEVTPYYDPMIAKLIVHARDRGQALAAMHGALASTRLIGIETNLDYLRKVCDSPDLASGAVTTSYLSRFPYAGTAIEVLQGGPQTTVQDYPGRIGYWNVGVPPSGPMDSLAFRLANRIVGNDPAAAAIEITISGPEMRFGCDALIALAGADMGPQLDGTPIAYWTPVAVKGGSVLKLGSASGPGMRAYLAVAGGFDAGEYLGSLSTFMLGAFGGHAGRALRAGDVIHLKQPQIHAAADNKSLPQFALGHPSPPGRGAGDEGLSDRLYANAWTIGVLVGPHTSPDFFLDEDMEMIFATDWRVHHHSDRTGVRLIGPKPKWARPDGGEAGLHPSNLHDNAYAVGAIDFTGDMPIILGPDGPSLGGFVCPAVIIDAELWKIGQLRPGDTVRFQAVTYEQAVAMTAQLDAAIETLTSQLPTLPSAAAPGQPVRSERPSEGDSAKPRRQDYEPTQSLSLPEAGRGALDTDADSNAQESSTATPLLVRDGRLAEGRSAMPFIGVESDDRYTGILSTRPAENGSPSVVTRADGDRYLLVEFGPNVLDLSLRLRAYALETQLRASALKGIIDITGGVRSLQVHYDPRVLPRDLLFEALVSAEKAIPHDLDITVPSRVLHMPISWNDPATRLAAEKYMQGVRPDAPWCPDNIEFIRRINGLGSIEDVHKIVFDASYFVLGLGDVYLGAPVATPIDPRHRLVTTKYNPARTWTPENAVGIGGAYMCIYGMEGPGGYQLFGRTVQVWNTFRATPNFEHGTPWLLRCFDRIRFYPVGAQELLEMRDAFPHGKFTLRTEEGQFRYREYQELLGSIAVETAECRARQQAAFADERARWAAAGQEAVTIDPIAQAGEPSLFESGIPEGHEAVTSPLTSSVWKVLVEPGQPVAVGEGLVVLEAMKTETHVVAPVAGIVTEVRVRPNMLVNHGQPLIVIRPA